MKIHAGEAGELPEFDNINISESRERWVFIFWDKSPEEWFLLESETHLTENDLCNADIIAGGEKFLLTSISEVYLELEPTSTFKIYIGSDVLQYTPVNKPRDIAALWVDAIFSAMKLQDMDTEETCDLRKRVVALRESKEREYLNGHQLVAAGELSESEYDLTNSNVPKGKRLCLYCW